MGSEFDEPVPQDEWFSASISGNRHPLVPGELRDHNVDVGCPSLPPPCSRLGPRRIIIDAVPCVIQIRLTMKSATIRDLRNSFPTVARWIEEGECVEITRSGKPFARLEPIEPETSTPLAMPDFLARMRKHFPNEKPGKGLSSVVNYDRGDR